MYCHNNNNMSKRSKTAPDCSGCQIRPGLYSKSLLFQYSCQHSVTSLPSSSQPAHSVCDMEWWWGDGEREWVSKRWRGERGWNTQLSLPVGIIQLSHPSSPPQWQDKQDLSPSFRSLPFPSLPSFQCPAHPSPLRPVSSEPRTAPGRKRGQPPSLIHATAVVPLQFRFRNYISSLNISLSKPPHQLISILTISIVALCCSVT